MQAHSLFEWLQLFSSLGIFGGGFGIFKYVLRTDRRLTTVETALKMHLKDKEETL